LQRTVKVLVAHNNAEVVAGPVVQEKEEVCGGK
jgi:glycerol-3-phosphate responsive antiterminator